MKKIAIIVVCQLLATFLWAQKWKETIVCEDKNVKVFLKHRDTASVDQPNWLQLVIKNKTPYPFIINDAGYSIFQNDSTANNAHRPKYGFDPDVDEYYLFHQYYKVLRHEFKGDAVEIAPHGELVSWQYLTNHASTMECSRKEGSTLCHSFQFKLTFSVHKETETCEISDTRFCFYWKPDTLIETEQLARRLKSILKEVHVQPVHHSMLRHLMGSPRIVQQFSTDEFIDAIMLRNASAHLNERVIILTALKNRGATPNKRLTEHYRNDLAKTKSMFAEELRYYWDNELLQDLLKSQVDFWSVSHILQTNADSWSSNLRYRADIYDYFLEKTAFKLELPTNQNFKQWSTNVQLLAFSRDERVVDYLAPLLNNEQVYVVYDYSKNYMSSSMPRNQTPDTLYVRLCDVAYKNVLIALNKQKTGILNGKMTPEGKESIMQEISSKKKENNPRRGWLLLLLVGGLWFLLQKLRKLYIVRFTS